MPGKLFIFNDILKKHKFHLPVRYGISNRLAFPRLDPVDYLESLFRTSAQIIQWREKDLDPERTRVLVRQGVRLARKTGKIMLVNSFVDIALEEGADGVHLTSSQDVKEVEYKRKRWGGKDFLMGKSVHSLKEAQKAAILGLDYVILGPIFPPLSKRSYRLPLGTSLLHEVVQRTDSPVIAVGGIDESRFEMIFRTGAAGVAGISWVSRELGEMIETQDSHQRKSTSSELKPGPNAAQRP